MRRFVFTLLAVLPLVSEPPVLAAQQASPQAAINEALQQMLEAWNRDDLDAHIAPYADSATWMTASGLLRGRDANRASLIKSFQRGADLIGELRFSDTEFHPLDTNTIMTTGAFHLTKLPSGKELNGRSTLLWVRRGPKWLIIHDHSS